MGTSSGLLHLCDDKYFNIVLHNIITRCLNTT